jgi:hypothetical protein
LKILVDMQLSKSLINQGLCRVGHSGAQYILSLSCLPFRHTGVCA